MMNIRSLVLHVRGAALRVLHHALRSSAVFMHQLADVLVPRLAPRDVRHEPVLCFGDSITEGYHNVWPHAQFAPTRPPMPTNVFAREHAWMLNHPYSIRLGELLSTDAGDCAGGYKDSLRYARAHGYSGWSSADLLPVLSRALREGPWRAVVLMAGINDILWEGASAATVLSRIEELCAACEAAGVPVVVLSNVECDFSEFFSGEQKAERTAALAEVAAGCLRMRATGRVVVDTRAEVLQTAENYDDAIHLNPRGSDLLGEVAYKAIKFHGL